MKRTKKKSRQDYTWKKFHIKYTVPKETVEVWAKAAGMPYEEYLVKLRAMFPPLEEKSK